MEASRHFGKLGIGGSQGLSSRRNSILLAVASAVLAAVLIYLFVTQYDKSKSAPVAAPVQTTVWVATHPIPAGTPESAIAAGGYFKPEQVTQVTTPGAISDPSQVVGEVTNTAIAANQQISASDFIKEPALTGSLKGTQRAVAFTFDSEHGLTTWLAPGDAVDIMLVKGRQSELVEQNVTVLENQQGLVVLKLTDKQALLLTAFSAQGSLWLSLRPALKATSSIRIYSQGG